MLVGRDGTVYASDGTGPGANDSGEVVAYTAAGRLLWRVPTRGGTASLAERADGIILIATSVGLTAVSPRGARLWSRALPPGPANTETSPSLVIDAAGRAYVGSADGTAQAIAPTGALLWTLQAGGPSRVGVVPGPALGPSSVLAVTGADGVLRLYQ